MENKENAVMAAVTVEQEEKAMIFHVIGLFGSKGTDLLAVVGK